LTLCYTALARYTERARVVVQRIPRWRGRHVQPHRRVSLSSTHYGRAADSSTSSAGLWLLIRTFAASFSLGSHSIADWAAVTDSTRPHAATTSTSRRIALRCSLVVSVPTCLMAERVRALAIMWRPAITDLTCSHHAALCSCSPRSVSNILPTLRLAHVSIRDGCGLSGHSPSSLRHTAAIPYLLVLTHLFQPNSRSNLPGSSHSRTPPTRQHILMPVCSSSSQKKASFIFRIG